MRDNLAGCIGCGCLSLKACRLANPDEAVGEMVAALGEVAGPEAVARIRREPDQTIRGIVAGWPRNFDAARAAEFGFTADASFQDIIRAHIRDTDAAAAGGPQG